MIKFLNNSLLDIKDIIVLTSEKQNIPVVIVEKDMWLSLVIQFLFEKSNYKEYFQFKGGTSLSKAFNLVERFSEDVDITLNEKAIGVSLDELNKLSANKRSLKIKLINEKAVSFYKEILIPEMHGYFSGLLNKNLGIELKDEELAIYVTYPNVFEDSYIKNQIKIEIGPISAWLPNQRKVLNSYIYKSYPNLFEQGNYGVLVMDPVRTFVEKVFILHKEAHRTGNPPLRYSRHYYDLYKIYINYFKNKLVIDVSLIEEVRKFNQIFYYRNWANFEEAKVGTFKLVPNEEYLELLRKDYDEMKKMIYGDDKALLFDDIIDIIRMIEKDINGL